MRFHRVDSRNLRRRASAAVATPLILLLAAAPAISGPGVADARSERSQQLTKPLPTLTAPAVLPTKAKAKAKAAPAGSSRTKTPVRKDGALPQTGAGTAPRIDLPASATAPRLDLPASKLDLDAKSPVVKEMPRGLTPRASGPVLEGGLESLKPAPIGVGIVRTPVGLPVPTGRDAGMRGDSNPRDAADAIRAAVARRSARIHRLAGYVGYRGQCANPGESLVLEGTGFGETRSGRSVVFVEDRLRGERVAAVASIASWSASRIETSMPSGLAPGATYRVTLRDAAGQPIVNGLPLAPCRTEGRLVVNLETTGCAFSHADVRILARAESGREVELPRIDTGNDLELRFQQASLPLGRYSVDAAFRGEPCPGGDWSGARAIEVSHATSSHTVALRYDVAMRETRIPAGVVSGLVQSAFDGTRIRVNNYDRSRGGDSRFVSGDAFIELAATLGGSRTDLSVPEMRSGAFRYYVQDWNLASVNVRRIGDRFRMRLAFESGGREIKGHCFDGICPFGNDDTAPDGDVNGATVDVFFEPIRYNTGRWSGGDISIGNVQAEIDANLSGQGIAAPIVEIVEGQIKAAIFPGIERLIVDSLEQRPTQVQVANGIRDAISSQGLIEIGNVQGVFLDGADLVIRHLPRRS